MKQLKKFILFLALFAVTCSFLKTPKNDTVVEIGNVVYCFENGKIQCLSEKDAHGEIKVLLKSLKSNTKIQFTKIEFIPSKGIVLTAMMLVEDNSGLCASWTNMQEIKIVLEPKPVQETKLTGKVVYEKGNITVFEGV